MYDFNTAKTPTSWQGKTSFVKTRYEKIMTNIMILGAGDRGVNNNLKM